MDADSGSEGHSADTSVAYPTLCTEERLLPILTDHSLQSIMASPVLSSPRPAVDHAPLSPLPDLRLVLLGRKGAGKSAAGNTILGAGFEFGKPTEECIKRRADVDGLKVTVVDTPGWEWYYPRNSTPNWVRRETLRSVTLCPPGPHAVLLVIRSCASVNEDYIKEIVEHLFPLGVKVWEHALVLFTRGDELGLVSMEQRIQTSPGLQTLLHKCGNRYHVMETRLKNDGTQVQQLMRKLKKMVEEKEEREYLEINNSVLSELDADGSRRACERRKKQRQMEAQAQRGTIKTALMSDSLPISESDTHHSFSKTPRRLPEVRLVILGERETGKSSAANSILGQSDLFQSGTVTEECVRHQATVSMRQVTLVDTPGWDGGVMGSTPERVKREIVSSVVLCQPGPHAFLVTLRVDTAIRESHVREHLELLGENIWRYTILLFTHCDQLREGVSIEQHIQKGGKDLQTLLEKCRGRYHALGNSNCFKNTTQVTDLLEKVEKMAATNRCEAFSGLVQEVKSLSRQKNEKQSQRFKELTDKMLRQEAELKKLRDREIKSLRWLFDWKKKSKSAGNSKKEEEADEEKRNVDENLEDLQERMRFLIDDKEREIQDLHAEHERMLVVLHQSRREAQETGLNIEIKEREIDDLNERIDEQQAKMLDLERIAVDHELEKQQHKKVVQEWQKAVQHVKMVTRETEEWKERVDKLEEDLEQAKRCHEEEVEKLMQEKDIAIKDFEDKLGKFTEILTEKHKEFEQLNNKANEEKQKILDKNEKKEQDVLKKMNEIAQQHEKEKDELKHAMEEKICEMDNRLEMVRVQHFEENEQILNEQKLEFENLTEQLAHEAKTKMEIKQRELVEMEQKYVRMMEENSQEHKKDVQMIIATHKQEMEARDNEIAELKEHYQDEIATKIEILREEFARKYKENHTELEALKENYKVELEEKICEFEKCKKLCISEKDSEIQDLKCKYMDDITKKEKDIEQILKERAQEIHKLNLVIEELKLKLDDRADVYKKLEDKEQRILDLKESLKEVEEKLQEMECTKDQERKLEIGNLKEQFSREAKTKMETKQRELVEMEKKYVGILEQKSQEHEKEMQRIMATHRHETEARDNELKEQYQDEITRKIETLREEFAKISKEKDNEIQVFSERCISEKDNEMQDLKFKYMEEINKKEKDIEQVLKDRAKEIDKLNLVIEELKVKLDKRSDVHAKLEDKENIIFDLKESLKEFEGKLQEMEGTKDQERKLEIGNLREQLAHEAETKMEIKQRELVELEQKYVGMLEGKSQKHEKDMQMIMATHKQEMEARDNEIAELEEQYRNEIATKIEKMREEFERKSKEKDKEIEAFREIQKAELEEKMSKFEKCKELCISEKDSEIQDLKCKYMDEMNKKEKDTDQILNERAQEIDDLNSVIEELKLKLDERADVYTKLDEKEQRILDLKKSLKEVVGKLQEMERTKDQEKKLEIGNLKEQLACEAKANIEFKQRELEEMEQKYVTTLEEKSQKHEKDMQIIMATHKLEMEVKENEIADLKEQYQDEIATKIEKMREEFARKSSKTDNEIEAFSERCISEKDSEIQDLKCKYMDAINKKDKDIEQILKDRAQEIDKLNLVIEELKLKLDERADEHGKQDDKEQRILDLKERLKEAEEKLQETECTKDTERKLEIENVKKQLAQEAKAKMDIKQRELAEMEQKYVGILEEKSQEHEKDMQMIMATHKQQMEARDNEIAELKEQYQDEIMTKMEKLREEFAKTSKETDNEVEAFSEWCIAENNSEIPNLPFQYMYEINKKEKDIEQIMKERAQEIDKLNLVIEDLKLKLDNRTDEQGKIVDQEQKILDLNESLKETEEKLQVMECTKDQERRQIEQKLVEKEQLILMLNEKLKDIEGMLQKNENKSGQILQCQKEEAAFQLEIRDKNMDEIKQKLLKESEKSVEKRTNEMEQIQNELMLKQAEIEKTETQGKHVQEIEELKGCVKRYREMEEGYRRNKADMSEKLAEKDKDLDQMRLIIEQTKAELNELTQKMEKEMTSLIQEYERGMQQKNEEIERIMKDRDATVKGVEQDEQRKVLDNMKELEKSQKTIEELEGKMIEEMQKAEIKCKQMREACEARDKQLAKKQSEFDSICKNYEQEILEQGTINSQLQKERGEMREDFEKQVAELKEKQKNEDDEMKTELAQKFKEIEIWVREKRSFEEKVLSLECKEEELAQWEMALVEKQDKLEENNRERQKAVEQKERELEHLLKALEDKQMELSFHGQDLQKKVRGLKDQGKELKDKESSLRNQEQELINWTSQLEAQNEHVSFTTQQLDEMGKDLTLLKQELQHKDKKYRMMFDSLNKWEVSLREREAQLDKNQNRFTHNEEEIELMHQDIGETRKDKVHETAEFAPPKGNDYHFETLKEIAKQKEAPELQLRQDTDGIKVISGFKERLKCPQNNKEPSDLTILVLSEAWSSRSPSGVSILGGEEKDMPEMNSLRFRSWRGVIAGRQVSIVEPAGLKWQDCTSTSRENLLEAVTWCEFMPSVVLLVLPVFLTCTESYKKAIEKQVNSVGSDTWQRAMVLFTWSETLGVSVDQHIQRNAELNKLIARCGGRYHAVTGKKNSPGIARLFEKMDDIVALNKGDVPR